MKRDVFYAIADPTRRKIITLTARGCNTPNEMAKKFKGMTRQAVSCHIQVLVECGVLKSNKSGRTIRYSPNNRKLSAIYKYLDSCR